jgi:sugar (pentulose or hexulose) kinase
VVPVSPVVNSSSPLYIGIDVGTSGCRAVAIDAAAEVAGANTALPAPRREGAAVEQEAEVWWEALCAALDALLMQVPRQAVKALAVDGTSGTVLMADAQGTPLAPALLYNDNRAIDEAERIRAVAPRESAAHGSGGGLAKLLWLLGRVPSPARVHSPADWLAGRLTGRFGASDANNVLKLGWDPLTQTWPRWLDALGVPRGLLPRVVAPGTVYGRLAPAMAARFGLPADACVAAGTTDSTAAIIATGAARPGEAVTSLGSTLVMKVVSEQPVFSPEDGVYSQPYGRHWLVGGGSNSGGAVLRQFFSDAELLALTPRLAPERPTGLDYYPLPAPGERFPVNDPRLAPRLMPRPADDAMFLQGLLEAMARIEADAYRRLVELGAPAPQCVLSAGGGAHNAAWSRIREGLLGVPVRRAAHDEAAYGSALLARRTTEADNRC